MKKTGIYKIQSKIKPERIYIGSAMDIDQRWKKHLRDLKYQKHHSFKLQRHYNKYQNEDLEFVILLECDIEYLVKSEQYYIDFYKPYFNVCLFAGSTTGRIPSKETREKLRQIHKGRKHSEEWCRNAGAAQKGKKLNEEQRKFLSKINIGNKNAFGHKISEEGKAKFKEKRKYFIFTEEARMKMSLAGKGRKKSEEHKRKISESNKRTALLKKMKLENAA